MYTVIDLFAGAGGLSLGFQQTNRFDIKAAFENNPYMQETYRRNHNGVEVYGDIRQADYADLVRRFGPIDVVIGGPPCQGFSNANRQRNQAVSQNNSLVKEYIRAILELRPKAFVMENVSMLRSDIHRFYLTANDQELSDSGRITPEDSDILLLDAEYIFSEAKDIVKSASVIEEYLWPAVDYMNLNIIYKAAKNPKKLADALGKHKKKLEKIADGHCERESGDHIKEADADAFEAVKKYYAGDLDAADLKAKIAPAIMYQRMLSKAEEIHSNHIIVSRFDDSKGLRAKVSSYSVVDYLNAMLAAEQDQQGYSIRSDVLSAAEYGVPQKRMRFVLMGIRRDIADSVRMPEGTFTEENFRTVEDAIQDLEDTAPVYEMADDTGTPLKKKDDLNPLAASLRDSSVLYNHIITKTTDTALARFRALKQGQNFHALSDEMKTNTYTDAARTQNTIYLRLKYNEPSGTVINVRKSMWIHPTLDRAVSIREAARLQTFPDSFVFFGSKNSQYQQVGNAVPPILAKAIAETLADQLDESGQGTGDGNGG